MPHWIISPRQHPDLIEHLLLSRHILSDQQKEFFHPSLEHLPSPTVFPQISTAVARITQAIQSQEKIIVWGDFDADGITSTAILWQTLHSLGAQAMPYIPSRDQEGHGFSTSGIDQLIQDGVTLVITCDHGITAIEPIAHLQQQGIDVILTDHHEPLIKTQSSSVPSPNPDINQGLDPQFYDLPSAVAILHPLQTDLGHLAGCGVAYFLAYDLWLDHLHQEDSLANRTQFADQYLELAAIGTIADLMPLVGVNRIFASQGLNRLSLTTRPGLQQLYQLAKIDPQGKLGMYEVGFLIAPRLNAPGRLAHALDSLRLLCTVDHSRATELAKRLDFLNRERQDLLAQVTAQAKEQALASGHDGVFVLADPQWSAGVCGLAAGKLVGEFYRPTIVMENQGQTSRGSARSIKGFDINAALTNIKDLLISYGGHAMAAGFVCQTADIPAIQQALTEQLFDQLDSEDLSPTLNIDAEVTLLEITDHLYQQLQQFEPTGMGNKKPLFASLSCQLKSFKTMGTDHQHLRLILSQANTTQPLTAVAFGLGHLSDQLTTGSIIDIAYTVDQNTWQGRTSLQLMVKDLRIAPS